MRENRKISFEYAFRDEGENRSTYKGLRKYGVEYEVIKTHLPDFTPAEVVELDRRRAARLYASVYWKHPGCDNLSSGLDYFIFDSGLVCGGPRTPAAWLGLLSGPYGRSYEETVEYVNSLPLEEAISGLE